MEPLTARRSLRSSTMRSRELGMLLLAAAGLVSACADEHEPEDACSTRCG